MATDNDAEDPRWDPARRRELRQDMRDALMSTYRDREAITIPEELRKRVQHNDQLYQKVVSSREAVLDSEHFKLLSGIARHQSESSRGELIHFDHLIYSEKLLTFMGGQIDSCLDWCKLGETFMRAFRVAPSCQFLYGALEHVAVPVRVKSAARRISSKAQVTERPKEISALDEEETTTQDVQHIFQTLKSICQTEGGKVHYFKFLIDPDSFSHTVENVFHFSFLIKEGRAGIRIDDDEQPYIYLSKNADQTKSTNQAIISLDMKKWQMLIDIHSINTAMIRKRK